ncbi:hypothetical protein OG401_06315 [Kitasatospora purpeofusca]|uniref:hypothetical protein n=1 Tax=Kitasatospora purpeofusca TaxID=67352 RepID=UPI002253FDD6|nr:hypothetical protein [Kitasatospora purpeofusca]MCX4683929.1 hypothetical protein [Kitasatospora purpeofusca]
MGRNSQRRRSARQQGRGTIDRPDVSEISRARTAKRLRADIAEWLADPSKGPGGSFIEGDNPSDPVAVWAVLMHWLVSAREQISAQDANNAVDWVSDSLGIQKDDLLRAAGLIGHPDAPDGTLSEAMEHYGDDPLHFTLYMLLLSGGLVATVGGGEPDWLRQFDLTG